MKLVSWRLTAFVLAIAITVSIVAFAIFSRVPSKQDLPHRVPDARLPNEASLPVENSKVVRSEVDLVEPASKLAVTRPIDVGELWRVELEFTKARMAREKVAAVAAESLEETVQYAMFEESHSELLGLKDQQAWLSKPS